MNIKRCIFAMIALVVSQWAVASRLWIEAENFENKGGWVVDQQFMDLMGSPYLMAHGMGVPVADAATTIDFPADGTYYVYVRTYNWTSPWSKGKGPGKFVLKIDNKRFAPVLGDEGEQWMWQCAGKMFVKAGKRVLSLHDLTGFNGRCDAIYLTTEAGELPPASGNGLEAFRRTMLNLPDRPAGSTHYDLVVVGGGVAGICAAIAAARLGCKVALVNDRPVLGGNNSSEIRVHLGGTIEVGPNKGLGRLIREFGHSIEGNAQPAENYEDEKKTNLVAGEKNITLFANYRATAVEMQGEKIDAVVIRHIETGEELMLKAPLFSDCTGDGTIGYLAGADYRMGREARAEFGEALAPEKADKMTMGSSVQWYSVETAGKSSFPKFNYGVTFSEETCEKVVMGEWQWETGMNLNQIDDFERIRDYGLLVVYSNWNFLKNEWKNRHEYANRKLEWVAYLAGKRESRRLLGDYILKQDDVDKNVFHEDASFATTWSLDLHFPDSVNAARFPAAPFKAATEHILIYPYAVPYRCLYSRNVQNLFMAGRNISVTHVALGTVRVMRTTGMMGEVVGMAASLCKKYGIVPRLVYQRHLPELKTLMKEGIGKKTGIPDNQNFNRQPPLDKPRALGTQSFCYERIAPHPRLLWPAGGDKAIEKLMADYPPLAEVHTRILDECTSMLSQKPVERVLEGRRLLGVSRLALKRIFYLSYAYRMTKDEKYARRAEQEMLAVSRFTDWNPSHFLDVGEMVMALGIGYDWLYDCLQPEVRDSICKAIVSKGFDAAAPDAYFYRTASNWNSVCNGGLTYGALAIYEAVPDKATAVIEKCLATNPKVMKVYGPDGGYPEGFHYWGYGTSFQVMLIAALESAFGTDLGLSATPGFLESAYFMEYMMAPGGGYFNFSDAVNGVKCNMMMFWFAKKLNDLSLLWLERSHLEKQPAEFVEDRLLPCLMLFCLGQNLKDIRQPERHFWCNRGATPVFIYRGGWNSAEDSYLAVKGGSPRTPHAHMDAGSFVYEKDGVRWAMDLGMQNYFSLESKGVDLWNQSQQGQRWEVFRLNNEAHNTLTINGKRHLVDSYASFERTFETKQKKGVEVDMTSVFADCMEKVTRTVYLNEEDHLIVADELVAAEKEATVKWIMVTPADAKVTGKNEIELSKDGRRMRLTVDTPRNVEMKIWANHPPHDYDEPNPGSVRVGFEVRLPANLKSEWKVTLAPME